MPGITVRRWPIPTKDSVQLQFSSISLGIRGHYFPWVQEISYEQNLEPGEARGTSPYPMGVTLGELKANSSLTIQRIHRERFLRYVEQGVPGFMDKFFPAQVSYQEIGWDDQETDTFDARITGISQDFSSGNGVLMCKFPLYTPYVTLNGHIPINGIAV